MARPLPAGTYNVKLTAAQAAPEAVGTTEALERWVELSQGKEVKGREVVSIVPQAEIKMVVKDTPPASGASKVQLLKGNDYLRVWINKGGNHYLIHFPVPAPPPQGRRLRSSESSPKGQLPKAKALPIPSPISLEVGTWDALEVGAWQLTASVLRSPSHRTARDAGARPA